MNVKVKRYELLAIIIVLLLPISEFFTSNCDELLAIGSVIYLFYAFVEHRLNREEIIILNILGIIVAIGLLSNIIAGLVENYYIIFVDVLEFVKVIVVFLAFRSFYRKRDFSRLSHKFVFIAKILIIITFILAVRSQFGDIGMTMRHADGNIYPELGIIQPFGFYTKNGIQTYYLLSGCMLFILAYTDKKLIRHFYAILYFITNILTGANLVWVADAILVFSYFYYKKRKNMKVGTLVLVAVGVIVVAFPAIKEYLFDSRSPRTVLLYYGFLTANRFFPLGSGFSTYGGEMAARYYSPLYWEYGFDDRYGLSHTGYGGILNDNYVAMIMAQFGYIGLVLFGFIYYKLFMILDMDNVNCKVKSLIISVFGTIVCSMMISANSKTLMGVWIYAILGMCSNMYRIETDNDEKNKY